MWRYLILLGFVAAAPAATLERLSMDELITQSTAIVRGRVSGSFTDQRGPMIYTHFNVSISERWKGPALTQVDVVVPGGTFRGMRQTISGTPNLEGGSEYVLFIWTSKSGLNHVIGLSQGVFDLRSDARGEPVAMRAAAGAMVDRTTGREVKDESVRISLRELRERIARVLGAARE